MGDWQKLIGVLEEGNPYHEPAGTPEGGQFAHGPEGDKETGGDAKAVLKEMQRIYGKDNVLSAAGGFFVRDGGAGKFVHLAQARKETGIAAIKRAPRRGKQLAWGDYATIAALSGRLRKG